MSKAYLESHLRVSLFELHGLAAQVLFSSPEENGEQQSLLTMSKQ